MKQRHADVHLLPPPLAYVRAQRREPRVRVDDPVADVPALGDVPAHLGRGDAPVVPQRAQEGEGRDGGRDLVLPQLRQQALASEAHVALDAEEVRGVARVGTGGRGLDHPPTVFRDPVAALVFVGVDDFVCVEVIHNLDVSMG